MALQQLQTLPYYISHFFSEVDEHSLQSPFMYQLYRQCICHGGALDAPVEIERLRGELQRSQSSIRVVDPGAGSRTAKGMSRKISEIAKSGISPKKTCRLLCNLVKFFKPEKILELGTSLGLSAMCLGYDRQIPVITIEAVESLCALAEAQFKHLGYQNITLLRGSIDEQLPVLLKEKQLSPDLVFVDANHRKEALLKYINWIVPSLPATALIVVDDIRWSRGMYSAWKALCRRSDFVLSLDLRDLGLLIKRPGLNKQHFFLKY